jgi:hypothetical protein
MQLKTILNRVQKHSSFVYGATRMAEQDGQLVLDIDIEARANGRPRCSGCGARRPPYDRMAPRRFEFVPLWGILVFFVYAMRRVQCPRCGVIVEMVPWADGKHRLTTTYRWFLAGWARRLSWLETARVFRTTWENVFRSVEMAVQWGRKHVDLRDISAIGIDEIAWSRGHEFLTLVYQINEGCRRLLWVGQHRKVETLERFFDWFGEERSRALLFICSDMWKPYLQVIARKASEAVHVLDRNWRAMQRNRTICALSRAMVLVEARPGSGTMGAAEDPLRRGLPLLTVDFAEPSEGKAGHRALLERGARALKRSRASGRASVEPLLTCLRSDRAREREPMAVGEQPALWG